MKNKDQAAASEDDYSLNAGLTSTSLHSECPQPLLSPQNNSSKLDVCRKYSNISTASNASNYLQELIEKTISRRLTSVRKAIMDGDDEQQTYTQDELNEILQNRFELEDALKLTDTRNELKKTLTYNNENCAESLSISDDNQPVLSKVFTNKVTGSWELPPDGGYGWVCCMCVTLIMFSTWGCNAGFGVFLAFYLDHGTFLNATKYDYALVAGLTVFFGQGLSPFSMIMMRIFGMKVTMYIGIVLLTLGFVLASYATKLWQLYLTQGMLTGISLSLLATPSTTVLPGWFLKKRSFAMGLSLVGTGAGGVAYSLAVNRLIEISGDQKLALRVLAITCSLTCLVATILIRHRSPIKPTGTNLSAIKQHFKDMFSPRIMKMKSVQLISIWFTFALFGYTLMVFTLSSYAVARGLSQRQSSVLTASLNAAQCIGRPLMGLMGDKFGRTNTTVTLTFLLTIYLFAFWIPSHTFIQMLFFSICVGLCIGVGNVMNTVLVADIVGPIDFLPSWAYINCVGSPFMLVCELVAQALTSPANKTNPYLHTQIFSGLCFFMAFWLVLGLRELTVKITLTEDQKTISNKLKQYEDIEDRGVLSKKLDTYDHLLGGGIKKYISRMFYPMKV